MNSQFHDQVAVVTGAGGTLCSAIAKHLASLGCKVVLVGRTREKLEKVAESIAVSGDAQNADLAAGSPAPESEGARTPCVRVAPADVTDEAAIQAMADRVLAEWGPCRFLVNGAGGNNPAAMPTRLRFSPEDLANEKSHSGTRTLREEGKLSTNSQSSLSTNDNSNCSTPSAALRESENVFASAGGAMPRQRGLGQGPSLSGGAAPRRERGFWDIDMAAFRSVLEINTLGTVIPSRIFGLQMARAGGGAILNFASMNTYRPLTRVAPYAMAKAAIANWTQFFAQYMAPAHVRVNAVAPGFMVNERSRKYLCTPDGGLSPRGEQVMAHTPMGRFGEAEDLLGCVEWLLDDTRAAFVTGITVPVDGGFLSSAGV